MSDWRAEQEAAWGEDWDRFDTQGRIEVCTVITDDGATTYHADGRPPTVVKRHISQDEWARRLMDPPMERALPPSIPSYEERNPPTLPQEWDPAEIQMIMKTGGAVTLAIVALFAGGGALIARNTGQTWVQGTLTAFASAIVVCVFLLLIALLGWGVRTWWRERRH